MEERDRLMVLLIAVGVEICDRGENPELGELFEQLMDRLLEADTSEIADDARETIPRFHHLAPLDDSTSRSTTATRTMASPHSSGALHVGRQWRPCAGPSPGHHCAVVVKGKVRLSGR